jgi:hypothetical protein
MVTSQRAAPEQPAAAGRLPAMNIEPGQTWEVYSRAENRWVSVIVTNGHLAVRGGWSNLSGSSLRHANQARGVSAGNLAHQPRGSYRGG